MVTVIELGTRVAAAHVAVGVEPEGMSVSPDSKILVHRFHETARLFRIQLGFDSLNGVEDHDSMAAGD